MSTRRRGAASPHDSQRTRGRDGHVHGGDELDSRTEHESAGLDVDGEAPEVGDGVGRAAEHALQGPHDAAVGHDQHPTSTLAVLIGGQALEGTLHAIEDLLGCLAPRRPLGGQGAQATGPAGFDLGPGEAGPLADVTLTELGEGPHGASPAFAEQRGSRPSAMEVRRGDAVDVPEAAGGHRGLSPPEVGQRRVGPALPSTDGVPLGLAVPDEEQVDHRRRRYFPNGARRAQPEELLGGSSSVDAAMVTLRMFASARQAAGTGSDMVDGQTVGDVLAEARSRYGEGFASVLKGCRVWRNGEPTEDGDVVGPDDEVAILPPVSGG